MYLVIGCWKIKVTFMLLFRCIPNKGTWGEFRALSTTYYDPRKFFCQDFYYYWKFESFFPVNIFWMLDCVFQLHAYTVKFLSPSRKTLSAWYWPVCNCVFCQQLNIIKMICYTVHELWLLTVVLLFFKGRCLYM